MSCPVLIVVEVVLLTLLDVDIKNITWRPALATPSLLVLPPVSEELLAYFGVSQR